MDEFDVWWQSTATPIEQRDLHIRYHAQRAWQDALAIGEARGRVLGMEEAAKIVNTVKVCGCVRGPMGEMYLKHAAKAISQAAAQPAEVCEWKEAKNSDLHLTSCGYLFRVFAEGAPCPECGKPINVKGE
jgi:hypothetical protein